MAKGKIRKTIEDAAEKAVKAKLNILNTLINQVPNADRSSGCLNSDNTKIIFKDGEEAPVYVSGRPVARCGPVTDLGDGTYHMEGRKPDIIHIGGSSHFWYLISNGYLGPTPNDSFPVFNLVNGKTLDQYRLPEELMPQVFDTANLDPDNFASGFSGAIGDIGYNGFFFAKMSPNAKTLVIVRVKVYASHTPALTCNANTAHFYEQSMKVYWNVIKNFTLNTESQVIETNENTVVTGGIENYVYEMETKTTADLSDDGVPSQIVVNPFVTILWTGYLFPGTAYSFCAEPVIWFDSNGEARIDLVGRWESTISAGSYYTLSGTTGFVDCLITIGGDGEIGPTQFNGTGGLFTVEDLQLGGTLEWQNYGGAFNKRVAGAEGSTYTPPEPGYMWIPIANRTDVYDSSSLQGGFGGLIYRNVILSGDASRWPGYVLGEFTIGDYGDLGFKFAGIDGKQLCATRRPAGEDDTFEGDPIYFMTPYLTISETITPTTNTVGTFYIGDGTAFYLASNNGLPDHDPPLVGTGWIDRYNSTYNISPTRFRRFSRIKTTGHRKFVELIQTGDVLTGTFVGLTKYVVTSAKVWTYDSVLDLMIPGKNTVGKVYTDQLHVIGPAGPIIQDTVVVDFVVK